LGLRIRKENDTVVTSHGFALYIDESGLQHFEKVSPCGFEHEEVTVTSVERTINKKIPHYDVVATTISRFTSPFRYDKIEYVIPANLYKSLGLKY
jgi:lipoate-protein ligase B